MVIKNSYPDHYFSCLVQKNYSNGDVGFYKAKSFIDGLSYGGNLVAIFKCKKKINHV